ncbi:MAG TPA: PhoPQ-activated protein PqaA family protein [Candidatus Baltobacteraceae bacterium]|nr:PhoPQ-activated protein PqaA family protein [Candidatus Baltobacteraceae bacterium]
MPAVSQQCRSAREVDKPLWRHWLTITEPEPIKTSTCLLIVSGGSTSDAPLEKIDSSTFSVKLWQALNPDARDFRLTTIGNGFTSTDVFIVTTDVRITPDVLPFRPPRLYEKKSRCVAPALF